LFLLILIKKCILIYNKIIENNNNNNNNKDDYYYINIINNVIINNKKISYNDLYYNMKKIYLLLNDINIFISSSAQNENNYNIPENIIEDFIEKIITFLFELKINNNNNNVSIKNIKKLKSISNDLIKSILYQLVSNYNNNNTNINYILLNKLTNIQKKIF
jgi:hypothetical protein